jgi:transposase InsO family protein
VTPLLKPWQFMLLTLAGWINRSQQEAVEYLRAENQVLVEQLKGKRLRLTNEQRRKLAIRGKALGRKLLAEVATIVTPDTILAGHGKLIAQKWTYPRRGVGRPPTAEEVEKLVLSMAEDNPGWGYTSLVDRLRNLGHEIGRTTVAEILKANGMEPAPQRRKRTSCRTFIRAHWSTLAAIDFTTVEVWTVTGLATQYLLLVMDVATRRVELAGITMGAGSEWMKQVARNLTDAVDGFLIGKRYLLMDRDASFRAEFREVLKRAGVEPVRLPPKAPNCNPHIERFMLSLKSERLDKMVLFGQGSLNRATREYLDHYHRERNHQGLDGKIINAGPEVGRVVGKIKSSERLGGILRYYHREAA